MDINVTKRDGSIKLFSTNSIKKTVQWGVDGIGGVDDLADRVRIEKKRDYLLPVSSP